MAFYIYCVFRVALESFFLLPPEVSEIVLSYLPHVQFEDAAEYVRRVSFPPVLWDIIETYRWQLVNALFLQNMP